MNDNDDNQGGPSNEEPPEQTREEYINNLQKWVTDTRVHNDNAIRLWYASMAQMQNPRLRVNINNRTNVPPIIPPDQQFTVNRPGFYIYVIPPLWKRIVAEFIDFLILFVIKMLLTVVILESFDIFNLENYSMNSFQVKLQPSMALQISTDVLILELIHRFIVCLYETYWLVHQCATPGKKYMGLAVVSAAHVAPIPGQLDGIVVAHPCTHLNIRNALTRSLFKNIFIGLLLPVCFVLLFFKYNRTGYDLLASSLVVEYNPNPPLQQNH